MFDKFDFVKIQQEGIDKQKSNMALTTLVSLAGLGVLIVVEALFLGVDEDDEDDSEQSDE